MYYVPLQQGIQSLREHAMADVVVPCGHPQPYHNPEPGPAFKGSARKALSLSASGACAAAAAVCPSAPTLQPPATEHARALRRNQLPVHVMRPISRRLKGLPFGAL